MADPEASKPAPLAQDAATALLHARPGEAPPPVPKTRSEKTLRLLIESTAILVLLALAVIPLAQFGLVPLDEGGQVFILAVASVLVSGAGLMQPHAGYRASGSVENRGAIRRRDETILNALSIAITIVLALIAIVEFVALLVFVGQIPKTSPAIVTAAGYFVMFSTFTLLFLDLILVARTSFDSRHKGKTWHPMMSYILLGASVLLLALGVLKSQGQLASGILGLIAPDQATYIITIAVFLQLIGFRMLLRYPSLTRIFQSQLEHAKKADREQRRVIERRALWAYLGGLGFVMLSFLLIGGVTTGQVASGSQQTTTTILLVYLALGLATLIWTAGRYIQHRFLRERQKRRDRGELIAKRRLTPEQWADLMIYSVSGLLAFICVVVAVLTMMHRTPFRNYLATDFFILAFLIGAGPFGFRRALAMRRVHLMDAKFPDFLRDLAEGLRAGMTLPRALYSASRGVYGALTPEIKHMSAQVEWGISFTEALERFSKRVKTPLIERTVSLVTEASRAGGSVIDILNAASSDAREIQQILEDRRRQMSIYSVIIYVSFFVFLLVVYVLAVQFLPAFQTASQASAGQQVSGFGLSGFNSRVYLEIFFHAALVQGIGGGLVAGVMTEGHPLGGLKHAFAMTIVSWIFFRILV